MGKCSTFWFIWHSMTVPAFEPGLFNNQPFFRFHSNISKWVNIIIYTEMESTKNRLTLKLEILDDFPASAKVWFTQFTMMSSFTFCPSPRSSSTFNVYLKEWTGCELIMNRNYWTTGSDHTHLHTQGKNITCWRGQDCLVVTWQPSVSQLSAFVRESHFLLLLFHWEFFFFCHPNRIAYYDTKHMKYRQLLNLSTHIFCDREATEFTELWSQFGGTHTITTPQAWNRGYQLPLTVYSKYTQWGW